MRTIAIGTNVFIYHFHSNNPFTSYTNKLFDDFSNSYKKVVTSIITLTELLSLQAPDTLITRLLISLESMKKLEICLVDRHIGIKAAELRRKYRFRLPDAVQLATAIMSNADCFITNDKNLKKCKEMKVLLLTDL